MSTESTDKYPKIRSVKPLDGVMLEVDFGKDGVKDVDVSFLLKKKRGAVLADPSLFATVQVGEYGAYVEWPDIIGVAGNDLWRLALERTGEAMPASEFAAWMERMGLSLSAAADYLGLTRRAVTYYKTGGRLIPKVVMLACRALELERKSAA
jgi:hypothetical protein